MSPPFYKYLGICISTRVIFQWMSLVLDTWIEKNNHFRKWYDLIPLQTLFYFPFCLVEPASVWLFDSGIASLMPISNQESLRRDMQSQREEREWVAFHSVKGYWGAHKSFCPFFYVPSPSTLFSKSIHGTEIYLDHSMALMLAIFPKLS